jgi:hypothetical protein
MYIGVSQPGQNLNYILGILNYFSSMLASSGDATRQQGDSCQWSGGTENLDQCIGLLICLFKKGKSVTVFEKEFYTDLLFDSFFGNVNRFYVVICP